MRTISVPDLPKAAVARQVIVRRKRFNSETPRERDTIAWLFELDKDGSPIGQPTYVYRCPTDRDQWINGEERDQIIAKLLAKTTVFHSQKGFYPFPESPTESYTGETGWEQHPGIKRRFKVKFDGQTWCRDNHTHPHG